MAALLPGVDVLADAAAVAHRGALEVVRTAQQSVALYGTFIVALAGGSTPRAMYQLLSQDESLRSGMPWWQTHFFWGDERHVPPDSSESNYCMANEAMLAQSPVPPQNVHRVLAENPDAESAAAAYEAEIRRVFSQLGRGDSPVPKFDLLLLGMGTDGHTASLFPKTTALAEQQRLFVANPVEKLDTTRLTLTPAVLAAAARALVLVSGADKAAVLAEVLHGEIETDRLPAQLLRLRTRSTMWLLDEAASSALQPPSASE